PLRLGRAFCSCYRRQNQNATTARCTEAKRQTSKKAQEMTDGLIYWRDYRQNWVRQFARERAYYWHSNAKLLSELYPGDRLWFITSGKNLRRDPEQAGFLVAVWHVQQVMENLGDDPAYPKDEYRYRIIASEPDSLAFEEPIPVDHI